MNWIEIKIKTSTEAVDAVSNIFYEAGATGVVIEDPKDYIRPRNEDEQVWDYMDIPENLDPEEAVVTAYLLEDSSIVERAREIQTRIRELVKYGLEIGKAEMVLATVSDTDWDEAWKKYYKPTHVGQNIVIKPSWEDYTQKDNEVVIELDPGMAFGTGTHETTALCLEMLEQHIKHGCAVIDVGCGSGVLSIAAAKLGASRVFAIDKDEVAVEAAIKNAKKNRVDSILQVVKGNKLHNISCKADIIVANIVAEVIIDLSRDVPLFLNEGGVFLASGIIKERKFSVIDALERNGFDLIGQTEKGEWVALASRQAPIGI
jgi:ribosomal protein L11 methyltransferase